MKELTIRNLIDLVISDTQDGETRIEKMFEWHYDRQKTLVQWLLGAAASLLVAVVVALTTTNVQLEIWEAVSLFIAVAFLGFWGLWLIYRLRRIQSQFISTLRLFAELKAIKTFINRYREMGV